MVSEGFWKEWCILLYTQLTDYRNNSRTLQDFWKERCGYSISLLRCRVSFCFTPSFFNNKLFGLIVTFLLIHIVLARYD